MQAFQEVLQEKTLDRSRAIAVLYVPLSEPFSPPLPVIMVLRPCGTHTHTQTALAGAVSGLRAGCHLGVRGGNPSGSRDH